MGNLKISFLPKTRLGSWTVWLGMFGFISIIFMYISAELFDVITSSIVITMVGASSIIASIIAFFNGIIAVIKNNERSVLIFMAIFFGFVVLAFVIGNIIGLP